jgi:hypothetical protein
MTHCGHIGADYGIGFGRNRADWDFDRNGADFEAGECVVAKRIHVIVSILRRRQHRRRAAKIHRIEHCAQVDVERLTALAVSAMHEVRKRYDASLLAPTVEEMETRFGYFICVILFQMR